MARKPKPKSDGKSPAPQPTSKPKPKPQPPTGKKVATFIFSGPPVQIYLGPRAAASDASFLEAHNIKDVLSIGIAAARKVPGVSYTKLALEDSVDSSIEKVCDEACAIIDALNGKENDPAAQVQPQVEPNEQGVSTRSNSKAKALLQQPAPKAILIHCVAGVSRSPTIVATYLIKRQGFTLKRALWLMIQARPVVCPNPGFLAQLKEIEVAERGECSMQDVEELPKQKEDRLKIVTDEMVED